MHDYLLFIGDGSIHGADEFLEWCMTSIGKAREAGCTRLLFDNRTLSVELTQYDILEVADRLVDMEAQKLGFRLAVLSSRDTLEIGNVVETIFTNRSAVYKRFESKGEALEWLLSKSG